jgi:hypothetical protein
MRVSATSGSHLTPSPLPHSLQVLTRDRVKRNVAVATAAQAQAGAPPVGKAAGKRL